MGRMALLVMVALAILIVPCGMAAAPSSSGLTVSRATTIAKQQAKAAVEAAVEALQTAVVVVHADGSKTAYPPADDTALARGAALAAAAAAAVSGDVIQLSKTMFELSADLVLPPGVGLEGRATFTGAGAASGSFVGHSMSFLGSRSSDRLRAGPPSGADRKNRRNDGRFRVRADRGEHGRFAAKQGSFSPRAGRGPAMSRPVRSGH